MSDETTPPAETVACWARDPWSNHPCVRPADHEGDHVTALGKRFWRPPPAARRVE
jgi:hypothetical protein